MTETPSAEPKTAQSMIKSMMSWYRRNHGYTLLLAIIIGGLSGYIAVGFRMGIEYVSLVFYGHMDETTFLSYAATLPWWHRLVAPIIGGVVVCLMLRFMAEEQRVHAIPDVIEATLLKAGRFQARPVWSSAIISMTTLGAGGSSGREGPVVHACAGFASLLSERFKISAETRITLLGCAVASGVAASFNTPLAGVIFALEVVVGSYALRSFAPVVVASVLGTMVTRAHIGNAPAFALPDYSQMSLLELPAFALLGMTCAISAILFMRSITFVEDVSNRTPIPPWLRPLFGGVLLGGIAVYVPEVLGIGYEATNHALWEKYTLTTLLLLLVAKTTATAITLGTRFGGGVFSGSLYIGAMTGGAFGIVATSLFPEYATGHGFYALVGMASVTGAVLGAPISTVFMVFELTHNTDATIAIMLSTALSSLLVTTLHGPSFFYLILKRRNIRISGGRVRQMISDISVRDVMQHDILTAPTTQSLHEIHSILRDHPADDVLLVDEDNRLAGRLNLSDFADVDFAAGDGHGVTAALIARPTPTALLQDDTLETALDVFETTSEDHLPVVLYSDMTQPVGIVSHKKILIAYNRALLDARAFEKDEGK